MRDDLLSSVVLDYIEASSDIEEERIRKIRNALQGKIPESHIHQLSIQNRDFLDSIIWDYLNFGEINAEKAYSIREAMRDAIGYYKKIDSFISSSSVGGRARALTLHQEESDDGYKITKEQFHETVRKLLENADPAHPLYKAAITLTNTVIESCHDENNLFLNEVYTETILWWGSDPIDSRIESAFRTFDTFDLGSLDRDELTDFLNHLLGGTLKHIKEATKHPNKYLLDEETLLSLKKVLPELSRILDTTKVPAMVQECFSSENLTEDRRITFIEWMSVNFSGKFWELWQCIRIIFEIELEEMANSQALYGPIPSLQSIKAFSTARRGPIDYCQLNMDEAEEIGSGAYGVCFRTKWLNQDVVVKKFKDDLTDDEQLDFVNEAHIMSTMKPHPNVILFFGFVEDPFSIVIEYAPNGDLKKYLKTHNEIPLERKLNIIVDICRGMAHLSQCKIIHRDLSARNVLLAEDFQAKVADFGLSRITKSNTNSIHSRSENGPLKWLAPETAREKKYSEKSDVWGFGVTCFEILAQEEPYKHLDGVQAVLLVANYELKPNFPRSIPASLMEILSKTIEFRPEKRPKFSQLVTQLEFLMSMLYCMKQ